MKFRLAATIVVAVLISSSTYAQGDPAKAQQIVTQVCSACHGADGNSTLPNPALPDSIPSTCSSS